MARNLRVEFPGAIYHVTMRGNARGKIFLEPRNYERFLWRLSESADTYNVRIYLFCLMVNHAHIVLETPEGNLSRFMQSFETGVPATRARSARRAVSSSTEWKP